MTPLAVTEGASAASDREPSSRFLPTDKNYRLTGELPGELEVAGTQRSDKEEHIPAGIREDRERERQQGQAKDADTEEASAASESDTAAASEAAETQREEKGPARSKFPQTSETRWQRMSRENRELREKLARAEGRAEGQRTAEPQRDAQQGSQPAADAKTSGATSNPKPKIDDVDPKTNQPKYKTFADYEEAKDQWLQDEAVRKFQAESSKTAKEREFAEAEQVIARTINERVAKVREQHTDYNDVITSALAEKDEHGRDVFFYTKGSPIDGFFLDSERGHEVMYEIGKNFARHKHIFARDAEGKYLLNPVRQLRELAKIENALPDEASGSGSDNSGAGADRTSSSSARPITQASRPPHQVSGKGAVVKDAVEEAVKHGDSETYIREQNARILAKRQRK